MHRTRPERALGVTLIELVVAIVITGIVLAMTVYFANPVRQSVDLAGRADLTDAADNALQRIGRDVRLALPNSVRVTTPVVGGPSYLEFIPIRTAGRYRAAGNGANTANNCGSLSADILSFGSAAETCFMTLGTLADAATVNATRDWLVLNNYSFASQDAYEAGAANRRQLSAITADTSPNRHRVNFTSSVALDQVLHDSPGKRFFIAVGRIANPAQPEPVSYVCTPSLTGGGTLVRRWGYDLSATQPTSFTGGTLALIAGDVTACSFDYASNVAPQIGLLTLRMDLSRTLSGGAVETVTLYHSVHVNNVP